MKKKWIRNLNIEDLMYVPYLVLLQSDVSELRKGNEHELSKV